MQGEVRLLGFPLLNEFPQKKLKDIPHQENLLAYLKTAALQPMLGMKKLQLFSKMENIMTDEDGALRQDWKLGHIPELEDMDAKKDDSREVKPEEEAEDEEDDPSFKEEPVGPLAGYQLGERTVTVGEPVVALGTYSATQLGIQGRFKLGGMPNELYPGSPEAVSKKIRGNAIAPLIFSILFFSFFHGLMTFMILNAPKP